MLAAGAASRFGAPKQRLFLPRVLAALGRSSVGDIVIVAGAYPLEAEGVRVVECPDWERGPGASLRSGLDALGTGVAAAVVCLADGPNLSPAAVDRVIEAWQARSRAPKRRPPFARDTARDQVPGHGPTTHGQAFAASYGAGRGHPVLLPRELWASVPDEGARTLPVTLVPCDDIGSPGDVDRADDMRRVGQGPAEP